VQQLAGDARAGRRIAVGDRHGEELELRRGHREAQGPGIVDVGADIGVEDDPDGRALRGSGTGPGQQGERQRSEAHEHGSYHTR
jgi:hypothetical protein